jgi:menaquinone-specific isochorismate synthase
VKLPDPAGYRAMTTPLPAPADVDVDLFALAARPGDDGVCVVSDDVALAGRGVAAVLPLPGGTAGPGSRAVVEWLAAMRRSPTVTTLVDDMPGNRPLAVGALPFDRREPARLVVPRVLVAIAADGSRWLTTVSGPGDPEPDADTWRVALVDRRGTNTSPPWRHDASPSSPEHGFHPPMETHAAVPTEDEFVVAVEAAVDAIEAGALEKVVLQRRVDVEVGAGLDLTRVLHRLHRLEPRCTVFADITGGGPLDRTAFIGATPELLVRRRDRWVTSHPLAGTVGRSGGAEADAGALAYLRTSPKERVEHRVAADDVARRLRRWCEWLDVEPEPSVLELRGLAHLGTSMHGWLARAGDDPTTVADALTLAADLHPTPAVAGSPTDAALALLAELEPCSRGRYAGPVGWVDAHGDGDFVIGIRSADVEGATAKVYAGIGVVAGSDPKEELAETSLKLRAALAALRL